MSLQVWLPLNGDLHNQGLNNLTITNNGTTINNNGKIGRCYYFNGDKQWLQFSTSLGNFYNNDWSFAAWLKPTDSTRSVIISEYNGAGASNVAIELTVARVVRIYWNGSPDINFTTAGGLPINEWTHLTITKQNSIFKIYFNGILKQTYTYNGTLSTRISNCQPRIGDDYRGNSANTVSYQGYMNDFRLYNHCLSAAEVVEIAKGLVLHYKLNNNGLGNENYWTNGKPQVDTWTHFSDYPNELRTTVARQSTYASQPIAVLNEYTEMKFLSTRKQVNNGAIQLQKVQRYTSTVNGMCPILENLTEGEYFTISYELYISSPVAVAFSIAGRINGAIKQNSSSRFQVSTINTWTKISQSIQITSDFDKSNITADVNYLLAVLSFIDVLGVTTSDEVLIRIRNIKLERGQEATSWTPARADFGHIDDNIIYDYSGYGNNGTIVGKLTATTGSPRYGITTQFPGSGNYIKVTPFYFDTPDWSISFWYNNPTDVTSAWESFISLSKNNGSDANKKMALLFNNDDKDNIWCKVNSGGGRTIPIKVNTWTHLTLTSEGKLYEDGVLKNNSISPGENITGAYDLLLGARASASGATSTLFQYSGKMSDFRIYATALTSEQVADLYHTSMSIDNQGNVYARELIEL